MNKKSIGGAALIAALFLAGCTGQSSSSAGAGTASDASAQGPAAANQGAAGGAPGNPNARRHFAEALMSLNLSDAEKSQIRDIMDAARAQAKTQDPDTRRATMRAAFAKVQAVLTPEQRIAFKAKLAALRAQSPAQAPTP
jgi:Spy/CpxP family protein refolding chaperone